MQHSIYIIDYKILTLLHFCCILVACSNYVALLHSFLYLQIRSS